MAKRSSVWVRAVVVGLATMALAMALTVTARAQDTAQVRGLINDSSGAPVPAALVTVTNVDTGVARSVQSGTDGRYLMTALPPGKYNIKIAKSGFSTLDITNLPLEVGQTVDRTDQLKVAAQESVITVTGEAPAVDVTESQVAGVVTQQQINDLPISNRAYLNLAILEPGTTQAASRSFYNNVQIGGADYYYANGFRVDGVSNTWAEMGEPRQNFPEGSVQEFRVYTNQFKASDGGMAMGGAVSIVTKQGTNDYHGELFEYFRNQALQVDTRFNKASEAAQGTKKAPLKRNQFGADVGGPIIKNRLHFYVANEETLQVGSYTIFTLDPAIFSAWQGVFPQPYHDNMLTARVDYQLTKNQTLFGRWAQEWNLFTCQGCGSTTVGSSGTYDGQFPRHSIVIGHTWTLSNSIVNEIRFQQADAEYLLSPTSCPQACGQNVYTSFGNYTQSRLKFFDLGYSFPNFSWGASYGDNGQEFHYEADENLSIFKGAHHYQFGFDDQYIPYDDEDLIAVNGGFRWGFDPAKPVLPADAPWNGAAAGPSFSASNLFYGANCTAANAGNPQTAGHPCYGPTSFSQTLPPIQTKVPTDEFSWWAQDDWQAMKNVSLSMGLRYDREFGSFDEHLNPLAYEQYEQNNFPAIFCPGGTCSLLQTIPGMGNPSLRGGKKNFAPRMGLSWDIRGNGKNVIRAGYGLYYNNIQTLQNYSEVRDLEQFSAALPISGSGLSCTVPGPYVAGSSGQVQCPQFPNAFSAYANQTASAFAAATPQSAVVLAQNFRNPYSEQYNLGFSHVITPTLSVHTDGILTATYGDYRGYDINQPAVLSGARPYPQFAAVTERFPIARSHYNAFDVRLDKRMAQRYQVQLSYTLSHCQDNNPQGTISDYTNWDRQFGDCSSDQRNVLVASGSYHGPWGTTIGIIWNVRSAPPFGDPSYSNGPNWAGANPYPYKNTDGTALPLQGLTRDQGRRNLNYTLVNAYVTSGPGPEANAAALGAACGSANTANGAGVTAFTFTPQCALSLLNPLSAVSPSTLTNQRGNTTDIRVARDFRIREHVNLEMIGQVFNVLGVYNYTGVQTSPTANVTTNGVVSQTWGQATGSNPLQTAELAAKITF